MWLVGTESTVHYATTTRIAVVDTLCDNHLYPLAYLCFTTEFIYRAVCFFQKIFKQNEITNVRILDLDIPLDYRSDLDDTYIERHDRSVISYFYSH